MLIFKQISSKLPTASRIQTIVNNNLSLNDNILSHHPQDSLLPSERDFTPDMKVIKMELEDKSNQQIKTIGSFTTPMVRIFILIFFFKFNFFFSIHQLLEVTSRKLLHMPQILLILSKFHFQNQFLVGIPLNHPLHLQTFHYHLTSLLHHFPSTNLLILHHLILHLLLISHLLHLLFHLFLLRHLHQKTNLSPS